MAVSSKRAGYLSLTCLSASFIFFIVTFLLGKWSGFFAISAVSWFIFSSALISFVLLIQFHQRSLAEQEKLDTSHLAGDEHDSTIFQAKSEQAVLFAVAQRRLEILEKWFIPLFSILIVLYQIGIGTGLVYSLKIFPHNQIETRPPLLCAVFIIGIAFASFLLSRYATGMSSESKWKPLRAVGSSLFGNALLCFVLAISLALVQFNFPIVIGILNFVIPIFLIILGVETALNTILDIYRPRIASQYSRASFDSRLLGILNEPGEVLHTAAGAIDYQFGFKVSQTWFFKLLEKAIIPLILFSALVLYALSCIVVVNPDEQAIIEYFGNPLDDNGNVRLIEPGLHRKLPWPFEIVYKYPTKRIQDLYIGYEPKLNEETGLPERERVLLWGKEHYQKEHDVLVASRQSSEETSSVTVPVSVVRANLPVQYRVKDLYAYLYNHNEPQKLLESICYRELAKFTASSTIEVNTQEDIERSLLGSGRIEAKKILTRNIQNAADDQGLGVEITFVGLQGIHPPPDLAADYQKVVGAVQLKNAIILNAHSQRNSTLSKMAGSVNAAEEIYNLAVEYDRAKEKKSPELEVIADKLDTAFISASGEIFAKLREAKSYAYEKSTIAKATGERFAEQLKAYEAAGEIYKHQLRLDALEEASENIRKYVAVADANDTQIFIIDVKEKLTPSLYDITGLEESKEQ